MTRYRYFLFFFFLLTGLYAQTANDVLKKMSEKMNSNQNFEYSLKYNLYKGHNSKQIFQSYNGFFQKRGKNDFYVKIDQTEILSKDNLNLKINHTEKALAISKDTDAQFENFDLNSFVKICKVKSYKKKPEGHEIVLEPRELSGLHYSKIILLVDLKYYIKKQVFYYNGEMDFSNNLNESDLKFPRLEVLYFNHKTPIKEKKPSLSEFISSKDNKRFVVSKKYKSYEFTDLRN